MTNQTLYHSVICNAKATILKLHIAESRTVYLDLKRQDGKVIRVRDSTHNNFNVGRRQGIIPVVPEHSTINVGDGCINVGIKLLAVWLGYPERVVAKVELKNKSGRDRLLNSFPSQ